MKKIIVTIASLSFGYVVSNAQCSSVLNNYEIKLTPIAGQQLKLQIRHTSNGVEGAKSILPSASTKIDGLVFAISWPTTSTNIKIGTCKSELKHFNLTKDIPAINTQNKIQADNLQTFFHNNETLMPESLEINWVNNQWYDLATIGYFGTLSGNDFFSLLNCDYGIAHPNSYSGNSSTDPWFALYSSNNDYEQFSPKMITELPSANTQLSNCTMYPIPTSGDLNIDIESAITTQIAAKVLDNSGKVVKIVLFELEKGKNKNVINLGDLSNGSYMVQVTDGKAMNFSQIITKN